MMSSSSCPWPALADAGDVLKINTFLATSRRTVLHADATRSSNVNIFLGNEAADLDSIVSSVVLAYWHNAQGHSAVPVVNCPRDDLKLRGDVQAVLNLSGINGDNLVFVDEFNDLSRICSGVWLVDHNTTSSAQKFLDSKVTAIVDHHADSGAHQNASPRLIAPVGSCSTLSFEICFGKPNVASLNRAAAALLLSAILVDTINMDSSVGRGTARDLAAITSISEILGVDENTKLRLFEHVRTEKQRQSHLSSRDLFRKDFKHFEGPGGVVGIASVGLSFEGWNEGRRGRDFALSLDNLQQFSRERKLDVFVVMTSFESSSGFSRELLIFATSSATIALAR